MVTVAGRHGFLLTGGLDGRVVLLDLVGSKTGQVVEVRRHLCFLFEGIACARWCTLWHSCCFTM